ncbi:MAG: LPS export ABC transporter periplasmic protein LptC [Pseudomonadota bacterium]|nr:LPS export ABC transporter periplasmic protein LptC [Pseudomonadota bacterium]
MHRPFIYLTIIGLAGVLLYFSPDLSQTGEEIGEHSASTELEFDGYSEGINTVFYNDNGEVDYTLRAIRQFHLKDQSSLLEEPLVRFFKNGISTWNIVAKLGLVRGNTSDPDRLMETIQLSGDVEVRRLDAYGNPTVLSTQRLDIDPNQETLATHDTVYMVTASITHTGRGMFADLNRDEINFYSDNSGHYASQGNNAATEQ